MPFIRTVALSALTAFSVVALPTQGRAYTAEEQQACQPDAFRLCGSEIPDVDRVTACMIARKSQLSPECRKYFRSDPEPVAAPARPAGQPVNIRPGHVQPVAAKKTAKPKKPETKKPESGKPEAKSRKPATKKPKPEKPSAT
jgi:hypothetical protein